MASPKSADPLRLARQHPTIRLRRRGLRRRGQALVEFALVLPVLMLILVLVLDFGRVFMGWVNLQNAARIGANFAAGHATAWSGTTQSDLAAQSEYAHEIQNDASTINCTLPSPLPTPTFPDGNQLNGRAEVQLTCEITPLTPIVADIAGNPVKLGASAVFPIRLGLLPVVPGATPAPTPSGTPAPLPSGQCYVPYFIGMASTDAASAWAAAGFSPSLLTVSVGTYTINAETPPDVDGTAQSCAGFQLAVAP